MDFDRRSFLQFLMSLSPAAALDWDSMPVGDRREAESDSFDAIIIGSGLGGLSCAAAFARQGFKALVLEQHDKPGGYATTFRRPGGFVFDVSLHSTSVGERDGVHNLIPGFPEIRDVTFTPHPDLYRAIFPDYDFRVPQRNIGAYVNWLNAQFPDEREGIEETFKLMAGLADEIGRLSQAQGKVEMSRFPKEFPYLVKAYRFTWGQLTDAHLKSPKLRAIISALWPYFGLPPSKLSAIYYGMPTYGYLRVGGYYPIGKSQKISDAFAGYIRSRGGQVLLRTRVERILVKDGTAHGVRTADGKEYKAKVVVSNASAQETFRRLLEDGESLREYLTRLDRLSVSLSCFQVFLGLKKDLVRKLGIKDTEIFVYPKYDHEAGYRAAVAADVESGFFGVTLYDNLYEGYSPKGKDTVNVICLQGFDHWEKYERDYRAGRKKAYRAEKERLANILIQQVEKALLPGLSDAIQVKEIGSPLTNLRYTSNHRGAIYGWDQTLDNSGPRRLPHSTPIKNLYLAGAWTTPGHGYGGVLYSGLSCFAEIMKAWS